MSDKSGQKDPSMEEILGSIRRIISEDSAQGGPSRVSAVESDDDEDVLELTDEVSEEEAESRREPVFGVRPAQPEDQPQGDQGDARREPVLALRRTEQSAGDFVEEPAPVEQDVAGEVSGAEQEWAESDTLPEDYSAGTEDLPETMPEQPGMGEESTSADLQADYETGEYAVSETSETVEQQPVESEWAVQQEEESMTMPSDEPAGGEEQDDAGTTTGEIMSDAASEATAAALGELNRAVSERSSRLKVGEGEITIAEVVKDLLRPMLREWLDENLPGIVERVVKREIQKLVDRTQDDD